MDVWEFAQLVAASMVVLPCSYLFGVLVDRWSPEIKMLCGENNEPE